MAIAVSTSLIPTQKRVPIDVRTVIDTIDNTDSISNPYIGLIFYAQQQDAYYKVIQLEQKKVGFSKIDVIKFYQKMPDNTVYNLIQEVKKQIAGLDTRVSDLEVNKIVIQKVQEN